VTTAPRYTRAAPEATAPTARPPRAQFRIARSRDPGARLRDRAQTNIRRQRANAWREGKAGGCRPPAD
jgi:hypothetical protein